jgi:hypothetical protein
MQATLVVDDGRSTHHISVGLIQSSRLAHVLIEIRIATQRKQERERDRQKVSQKHSHCRSLAGSDIQRRLAVLLTTA